MGTPSFAVPSLDACLAGHRVVAVYTRPDKAVGRGKRIVFSAVKERALQVGVPVEQPASLRDADTIDRLAAYAPDVVVVAAYGLILPRAVLDVPVNGCVNVHGSLLPRWRGAAPVQRAILAGDRVTGVSIMRMEEGLDTGPYAAVAEVPIAALTTDELTGALAAAGARALTDVLTGIEGGSVAWTMQDEASVTYAEKVTAADVALDPGLSVEQALRRVRASSGSAPTRVLLEGRRLVVLAASASDSIVGSGEATCDGAVVLGLSDGAVRLDRLVPEGRSAMPGDAFARGARLPARCVWASA